MLDHQPASQIIHCLNSYFFVAPTLRIAAVDRQGLFNTLQVAEQSLDWHTYSFVQKRTVLIQPTYASHTLAAR